MSIRRPALAPVVVALTALSVLALGACDSGDGGGSGNGGGSGTGASAKSVAGGGPSVVAPGKPGEPAKTLSAEEAARATPSDEPNSADYDYAEMMIVHHTQALTMTELVPGRAASPKLKALADRITAAQKPEIAAMRGWQQVNGADRRKKPGKGQGGGHGSAHGGAHGTPETDASPDTGKAPGKHDHASMPGMATAAQLGQLRAARGPAFDRLFLKLMITHHQGAVTMATDVLSQGNNVLVEEMANDVVATQTTEINRMRSMS
ncbi:DUF305 domain-containing protein [Streptomyces sp. NPDC050504]|uniref:DUF305 domain-containing protein n=1 Tax=Streptomyces sp. NPDC050504 TaxID=3365618 RepID=UPI003795F5BF